MSDIAEELDLEGLGIFLAVVNAQGFRAASKRLRLAPSTVSEKITDLERRLGVPLLTRTTRSVMPTEAGRILAARLLPLLSETRAALQDAASSRQEVRGLLTLNVTGAVMVDILPPLIDRFLASHPNVRIELVVEDRLVDITAAGCDAGIRYGEHLAQDAIAVAIGPATQRLAYAASPTYIAERGTIPAPRDLLDHDAVRLRFSSGGLVAWEFEQAGEAIVIDPPGRLIMGVHAAPAAIQAARKGRGVIGTFENWLQPYFDDGTLLPVLQDWWPQFDGPKLYFSSRFMPAPLRAFVDLVTAERDNGERL